MDALPELFNAGQETQEKEAAQRFAQTVRDAVGSSKDGHMEWIQSHPFKYDDSVSVDENINRATALAQEYLDTFGETSAINTPERKELRHQIVSQLYGDGAAKKERQAFIVLGLPASGKSSTVAEPLANANGALLIDSDMAKEMLPEYNNGILANAVHEESNGISIEITRRAIQNGDNIVLPLVGKTLLSLEAKINKLKEVGYNVNLCYVGLPVGKAVERAKNRFRETGRLVSPKYIQQVGLSPKQNYDKMKLEMEVDSYGEWDNDVEVGQEPRLLAYSETRPFSESWVGFGRGRNTRRMGSHDGRRDSGAKTKESRLIEEAISYNEISQEVFRTYLGEGIMKAVEETVAAEIGQYTNLGAMDDPVAKDKARDELPYIKALLVQFNSRTIQKNVDYKDRYAAKIEYARRCFDNDERIKAGATRRMVGNERQGGLHQNRDGTGSAEYKRGNGAAVQRLHGRVSAGISNQVSGEKRGAREHFEKLYNEIAQKHSENQGAFSHGLRLEQSAWHGSPYAFARFDLGAIGTGEGAQAHGWGLYFAKNQEVAEGYKNDNGGLYEADIPDDDVLLDEQKPFTEQPPKVKKDYGNSLTISL